MSDARRKAEAWLDEYGGEEYLSTSGLLHAHEAAVGALRLLLAEEPEAAKAPDVIRCAVPRGECCHQRIPPLLPLEAPECNDGDDCCRYCGRGLQPCGACKPAPPADAATEAVREAAEVELNSIDMLLDGRSALAGLSRYDAILLTLRVASKTDPKGEVAASLRALAARRGDA